VVGDPVSFSDPLGLWVLDLGIFGGLPAGGGLGYNTGIQVTSSEVYFYGGLGLGVGAGASLTIGPGETRIGTRGVLTTRVGNGVAGVVIDVTNDNPQAAPEATVGIGLGVGTGASVTLTRTIEIFRFDRLFGERAEFVSAAQCTAR
jgi:hypothetical protein